MRVFNVAHSIIKTQITILEGNTGNRLRELYYRKHLAYLGEHSIIDQGVVITQPENVHVGHHSWIDKNCLILGGKHVKIGNFIHVAPNVVIQGMGGVIVEDYVALASGCRIYSSTETCGNGKRMSGPMISQQERCVLTAPIRIEKDAFLGMNCVVLPSNKRGVVIGEGAVIGSGSLVSKDVQPWTVSLGIPLRCVGQRSTVKAE